MGDCRPRRGVASGRLTGMTPHVWEQRVSLADLDFHRHVNNARMLAWVQDSWADMAATAEGVPPAFVAVQHTARYQAPLPYQRRVRIETTVTKLGRSSVTGIARITDGSVIFAEITSTWVGVDPVRQRPRALTDVERESFGRHQIEEPLVPVAAAQLAG
ncbi:hypothetical protein DEH69_09460 [Streptomyces sp. PT12]|nr:hypothetical protein DEH69_09460 [Streptomyces sp. PT12]